MPVLEYVSILLGADAGQEDAPIPVDELASPLPIGPFLCRILPWHDGKLVLVCEVDPDVPVVRISCGLDVAQ